METLYKIVAQLPRPHKQFGILIILALLTHYIVERYLHLPFANAVFTFITLFAFSVFFIKKTGLCDSLISAFSKWFNYRKLEDHSDPMKEEIKINMFRIVTGALMLWRNWLIFSYLIYSYHTNLQIFIAIIAMFIVTLFMVGLFTPIVTAILFLLYGSFDIALDSYTLGTNVLQILFVMFLFLPAGRCLSLDTYIVKRVKNTLSKIICYSYQRFGGVSQEKINAIKFVMLISYGIICLYSGLAHVNDIAWFSGEAIPVLLTSSYLGRHFEFFQYLYSHFPTIAIPISALCLYIMLFWELLFIPLSLINRYTRGFVILWGLLFFIISRFALQLSMLPYYECILWGFLFWNRSFLNINGKKNILILYDDTCNLCYKTISILNKVDIFSIITFKPLSKNLVLLSEYAINEKAAYRDLYCIDSSTKTKKIRYGYSLYVFLSRKIFLLLPIFPVLLGAQLTGIGQMVYRLMAKNRIRLFGTCQLQSFHMGDTKGNTLLSSGSGDKNSSYFRAACLIFSAVSIAFLFNLPLVGYLKSVSKTNAFLDSLFGYTYLFYGIVPLNVFNQDDLKLCEHYFTISRINTSGQKKLLPFIGYKGERLQWHESDFVYFGHSLAWFRGRQNYKEATCINKSLDQPMFSFLATLDKGVNDLKSENNKYLISYYYTPLPSMSTLKKHEFKITQYKLLCNAIYDASSQTIEKL